MPEARLLLVGQTEDESYAAKVRQAAQKLGAGDRCLLPGVVPAEDLRRLYAVCDLFVLPSLWESQGLSVLEAMAAAKPVIASDIGPVRENVPEDAGVLVPPGDQVAMAAAIVDLLRAPGRAEAMGRRGRGFVKAERRWERMAELTLDAYAQFAGWPARPGAARGRRAAREALGAGGSRGAQ